MQRASQYFLKLKYSPFVLSTMRCARITSLRRFTTWHLSAIHLRLKLHKTSLPLPVASLYAARRSEVAVGPCSRLKSLPTSEFDSKKPFSSALNNSWSCLDNAASFRRAYDGYRLTGKGASFLSVMCCLLHCVKFGAACVYTYALMHESVYFHCYDFGLVCM